MTRGTYRERIYRHFLALLMGSFLLTGCSVQTGNTAITFSILGGVFELTFSLIGPIQTIANAPVTVATGTTLFQQAPTQKPPTGQMSLPSSSVGVARRLTSKTIAQSQALPLNGSATIRFKIAAGQSAALCDSAVALADFDLILTSGTVSIIEEVQDLSQEAIGVMMANDVTICIEINADFDGDATISNYFFAFGGGLAGEQPPSAIPAPPIPATGLTQIPIDNRGGRAAVAPINRTIAGVSYGVVGVLDATTPPVTPPAVEPGTISVVPSELGLSTVETLYLGAQSAFVPDVDNGVTIATLTVSYTDGGSPTTLDFVTGTNTSEWSYDRPEHTTAFGGVRHAKAPVLYSFETTIGSASVYNGFSYSVALPVDSLRTISSLALSMADPATYAAARAETGVLAGWAGHAITAITLAGQALVIPQDEACCFVDGSCADLESSICLIRSGTPQGDGTNCATADCPAGTGGGDQPEACCIAPGVGEEFTAPTFETTCYDIGGAIVPDRQTCLGLFGVPQGPGTSCAAAVCEDSFIACCFFGPFQSRCEELTFDACVDADGDPMAFGVHCDDFPCPHECCFDDGRCEDISSATCAADGGTPGRLLFPCDSDSCSGACCDPDGDCDDRTLDQCDGVQGDYLGLDVDCTPNICGDPLGGCCYPDTVSCFTGQTEAACENGGGIWFSSCAPNQCVTPCCLPNGSCSESLSLFDCFDQNGSTNPLGTTCSQTTCAPAAPTKWVLAETLVSPGDVSSDIVGTGRYEGKVVTYTETANSISVADREVDNGFEFWNVNYTSNFPTPPAELIPGETITLSASFTASGTVAEGQENYSWQFQYRVDGHNIHPLFAYRYRPFALDFDGTSSTTFNFVVKGLGGELRISAFWWNCSECSVNWIYRPG
ncbi:MAG: hypothetical protein ACE5E5_13155 [Phycisphaerae bacterium]